MTISPLRSSQDDNTNATKKYKIPRTIKTTFGSPFKGIIHDLKGRIPYYISDWTDAWNYRVIPSTTYMYFTNILPAIAFAQDMFDKTHNSYGVNEVLLASAMGGVVFGAFCGQPLCIVGVTGPISIFNYTVYEIINPKGIPYFPFMAWVYLWSMIMHFIIAALNWVNGLRYVSRFSCDIFGFFISVVYIQKGIQILSREFTSQGDDDNTRAYLAIIIALLVMVFGMLTVMIGQYSTLFKHSLRKFFADYGLPLTVIFFSGFAFFPGSLKDAHLNRLDVGDSFVPTATSGGRTHGWFIHFWNINASDVFLAIPFALLLTALFYFDHNVSSLICQGSEFPLKKPSAFHWDFFLLGLTTGISGILGIPAPNGLIPQAPLHTMSLCIWKYKRSDESDEHSGMDEEAESESGSASGSGNVSESEGDNSRAKAAVLEPYIASVVEQRASNFFQGLLILGTMSGPLLIVLGLLPKGVLAGLFWMMGLSGLLNSGITDKLNYIFGDKEHIDTKHPLNRCRKKYLYLFVLLEVLGAGAEIAITETVAAVGFPAVLIGLVGVGLLLPRVIPEPEMSILDGPAGSEFILQNLSSSSWTQNRKDHVPGIESQSSVIPEDGTTIELFRLEEGHGQSSNITRLHRRSYSDREVAKH